MRLTLKPPNRVLMTTLETERFILRPAGMLEILRDPGGWRTNRNIYRNIYFRTRRLSFADWLKFGPFPDGQGRFTFAIVPKGTSKVIGYHMIRRTGWQTLGNTVGIHDEAWLGKNVAVEVRVKLMNHFFRHSDVQRFNSRIAATNHPSIFTYRKLGYSHIGTIHRDRPDPETGEPVDYLLFEMLKADWLRGPFCGARPLRPETRAAQIIARAFNIQGEVPIEADMSTLPAWDSMNHVALLLEIEKELGRPLLSDEIGGIDSVRSIARLFGEG